MDALYRSKETADAMSASAKEAFDKAKTAEGTSLALAATVLSETEADAKRLGIDFYWSLPRYGSPARGAARTSRVPQTQ